jgi:hypothetical protein
MAFPNWQSFLNVWDKEFIVPTATYIALQNTTLSTNAASVTFSSIPATYQDLVIITNTDNTAQADYHLRFNGDTGNNYNRATIQGSGSVASQNLSNNAAFMRLNGNGDLATDFSHTAIIHINEYSRTDRHKNVLARTNSTHGVDATSGRWASVSAVTSVTIYPSTGSFELGSTFSLFGIVG